MAIEEFEKRVFRAKGRWAARGLALLMAALLMAAPVRAAPVEDVLAHNAQAAQQWVNWDPGVPEPSEPVCVLADQLRMQADAGVGAIRAIHDWVCWNICYDQDAYQEERYSTLRAEDVLQAGYSVCEGIANLVQALCLAMDIPCIKVWGVCAPEGWSWDTACSQRINHTWNECFVDGRWIVVDCTMDMKNIYAKGQRAYAPGTSNYLDPDPGFFARTHKVLQRGFDLPENIPSEWAIGEIQRAVALGLVPFSMLSRYREPVTSRQLLDLMGLPCQENADSLTRAEVAVLLDAGSRAPEEAPLPYGDMEGCTLRERTAAAALFYRGIMAGTGGSTFSPDWYVTRQEAILIALRLFEEADPCT